MITVNFSTRKIPYYRILQDDEMDNYNRPAGDGSWPMVFRLEPHLPLIMDESVQKFWYWLNLSTANNPRDDKKDWQAYLKDNTAFTNGTGILSRENEQIRRDYINATGLTLPLPKKWPLVCGRNVLRGVETKLAERQGNLLAGTWALKLEHLWKPDYSASRKTHPHFIHIANIITSNIAPDGLMAVNAFPQRGGREGYPVYYPVIAIHQLYYPLDRLAKVSQVPEPYNPA